MRTLALLVVVFSACAPSHPPGQGASAMSYIRTLSLPDGQAGTIECDTGRWRGTIAIAPDVKIGYQSTTTTASSASGVVTKTTITLNGRECVIEENGLRIGEKTVVPISGDARVEIRTDGVFVNGSKAADL